MAVQMKILTPLRAKDYKATLAAIDEVTASDPETADEFAPIRFRPCATSATTDAALALGEKLYEKYKDDGAGPQRRLLLCR